MPEITSYSMLWAAAGPRISLMLRDVAVVEASGHPKTRGCRAVSPSVSFRLDFMRLEHGPASAGFFQIRSNEGR